MKVLGLNIGLGVVTFFATLCFTLLVLRVTTRLVRRLRGRH